MRIIVLALIGFVLSAVFLLPNLNEQLSLPDPYYTYAPIALMVLAVLIQIEGAFAFKRVLKARQISAENDALEAELKDVTNKLHQEKKTITNLKSQLASLQAQREGARAKEKAAQERLPELQVVQLLALLQEKGRFIDFLMDDIARYPDEQVGAAARIVHQGCARVVADYFDLSPVTDESEGSPIRILENYRPKEYRFLGKVGEPPFQGTILHRGWGVKHVKLPRILDDGALTDFRVITPAEVELS